MDLPEPRKYSARVPTGMLDRGSVRLRHALHCYARRSFAEVIHKALFKNYTLKLRCKMETYQETSKVNATRFGVGGVHMGSRAVGSGRVRWRLSEMCRRRSR